MPARTAKAKPQKPSPKKPTPGQRLIAAIKSLSTPEAVEAAITGKVPPGAPFTMMRLTPAALEFRTVRAELGLTQEAFAAFLGVSLETLRTWEHGQDDPPGVAARFLAEIRGDLPYWKKRIAAR